MLLKAGSLRAARGKRLRAATGLLVIAAVGSGCGGSGGSDGARDNPKSDGSAGSSAEDASGPGDLEVRPFMYTPPEQPVAMLENGGPIELYRPPQGGHVILVGARVKGLESDYIELRVRVRVPETRLILAEKVTTVAMETVPEDPSFKQNDRRSISQVAHIAVCPDYDARDIVGAEQLIEVTVTELYADFSTGSAEVSVVPTCMQTSAAEKTHCECECTANYVLGRCGAARDAGLVDGGS